MNYMKDVAKLLGVELGEEFSIAEADGVIIMVLIDMKEWW